MKLSQLNKTKQRFHYRGYKKPTRKAKSFLEPAIDKLIKELLNYEASKVN